MRVKSLSIYTQGRSIEGKTVKMAQTRQLVGPADPGQLITMISTSGKELFMVCFSQADRKTKKSALPLLHKINSVEIAAAILKAIVHSGVNGCVVDEAAMAKLQIQAAKCQDDVADLKAKVSVNKTSDMSLVKEEYKLYCDALDEVDTFIHSVDKRIKSGTCSILLQIRRGIQFNSKILLPEPTRFDQTNYSGAQADFRLILPGEIVHTTL